MKIYLIKTDFGLKPSDKESEELYKKIKHNEVYSYEVKKPRNYKFHKKFFSLLSFCIDHMQETYQKQFGFNNVNDLKDFILIVSKRYEEKQMPQGEIYKKLNSISFASMDEYEFEELYKDTIHIVSRLANCEKWEIEQELINYM